MRTSTFRIFSSTHFQIAVSRRGCCSDCFQPVASGAPALLKERCVTSGR